MDQKDRVIHILSADKCFEWITGIEWIDPEEF